MNKEKSLVEEAFIQMKNLEETVAENAKGILESTMKQEIKDLVKESLSEQDEIEDEDTEVDDELSNVDDLEDSDELEDDELVDTDEFDDDDFGGTDELEDDETVIDLRHETNTDNILKVFQLMKDNDTVHVTKDESGNINLKDDDTDKEYLIVRESEEDEYMDNFNDNDFSEESVEDIVNKVFNDELEEDVDFEYDENMDEEDMDFEEDEVLYEIEMDEEDMEFDTDDEFVNEEDEEEDEEDEESFDLEDVMESFKAKGNVGKVKKVDFKSNTVGGFKTKMKEGPKSVGTGKAKFDYKDGENLDGEFKVKPKKTKKEETKEAARTLGNGSKAGRKGGLPKPRTASSFNSAIKENTNTKQIELLKEKNEEYRQALNVFRDKLNEVAVFNSNLAYATRLFTEHTTTKQEKINILKRFDNVETIKESKNLYQSIKDELTTTTSTPINESIERTINNSPTPGSSINLIESKTYENPQFLRMKDLMTKIK